jgi:glycosyltransferase involved in cell wall biosynthesis
VNPDLPRVLHISTERGFRGGERQAALLVEGLAQRSIPVAVAAPGVSRLARCAHRSGLELVALADRPYHPMNLLRVVREARGSAPGAVLHSHTSPALTLASLARRVVPTVRVLHTRRVAFPLRSAAKYRTAADRYVAISEAVASQLRQGGVPAHRLEVIYSGVDLSAFEGDRSDPASELVVCVGQLTPEKGHEVLLRAWREVTHTRPEAELALLGDGPLGARLRENASPSVRFVGHCEDVAGWLRPAALYVQPSLVEGLGTAVLEAMACSLAVVASAAGGLGEAVDDGVTGLLVPPKNPTALATAITRLLADRSRSAALGAAGRSRVEQLFRIEDTIERYIAAYRAVVR